MNGDNGPLPESAQKLGRVGGWAPGFYGHSKCVTCGQPFNFAEKRAYQCFPCAAAAEIERLRAAEAASPTAGWRDIATAERKPDNVIWAAHPGFKPFLAQWTLDTEGACWLSVEGGCDYKPTLWMPVAEPPRAAPTEEARAG